MEIIILRLEKNIWDYILWWAFILCMQSIITTMCLTEAVLEHLWLEKKIWINFLVKYRLHQTKKKLHYADNSSLFLEHLNWSAQ